MTVYWLDYSAAKLSGATIKAAGYGGVIRYIDAPDRLRTKHTTMSEYQDHVRSGLRVWLVMQNTTTDADGGRAAGRANATRAKAGADWLGYSGPIFFCNDRTTVPNPAAWQAYLDGAADILGVARVGAYGFANAMELARGRASWFWQAGRRTDLRPHVHLWQDNNTQVTVGGITCDRNLVLKDTEVDTMTPDEIADGVQKYFERTVGPDGRNLKDTIVQGARWAGEGSDDEQKLLAAVTGATGELLAAVAAIDGTPSDEQVDDLADKLNAQLGGDYNVTITRTSASGQQ